MERNLFLFPGRLRGIKDEEKTYFFQPVGQEEGQPGKRPERRKQGAVHIKILYQQPKKRPAQK
ncbi:MAG: hypothetical protein EA344_05125 [Alkalicoccus sp.]|nr:MAG: hypothetical protein EA344_05125 [Alkalicoccus sp.]